MESLSIEPGENVCFALGKVICPGIDELCRQIGSDLEIEGQIVFLSDYGKLKRHFAIVQAKGIHIPLIVPIENLQLSRHSIEESKQTLISKDKLAG